MPVGVINLNQIGEWHCGNEDDERCNVRMGCRTERGHYRVEGQKSKSFGPSKEGRKTGCCAAACIVLQCYIIVGRQLALFWGCGWQDWIHKAENAATQG